MTKEKFEKGRILLDQIASIDKLLEPIDDLEFKCDPSTRNSGFYLVRYYSPECSRQLTEGEMATIISALKQYRSRLEMAFGNL